MDAGKEGLQKHREILERELETVGIRLNQRPPDVTLSVRKSGGGVRFASTVPQTLLGPEPEKVTNWQLPAALDCVSVLSHAHSPAFFFALHSSATEKVVTQILREYKISAADVLAREPITVDQLVDVVQGNREYKPWCVAAVWMPFPFEQNSVWRRTSHLFSCFFLDALSGRDSLYLYNKIDQITIEEVDELARMPHSIVGSVAQKFNIAEPLEDDLVKAKLWEYLGLTRIYTKRKGEFKRETVSFALETLFSHCSLQDHLPTWKSPSCSPKYEKGRRSNRSVPTSRRKCFAISTMRWCGE